VVLALAMVGIGTLFLPLVTTDTPVLGETRWSLFDLAARISSGELPPTRRAADPAAAYLGLAITLLPIYVILLYSGAAALLSFHSLRRKLYLAGLVGMIIAVGDWHWDSRVFEEVFFGGWPYRYSGSVGHVAFGQLILAIVAVMSALVYVASGKYLDGNATIEKAQAGGGSRVGREPELLEAEVLPPEKESSRRPSEYRRPR
jgi:hypothetical protein